MNENNWKAIKMNHLIKNWLNHKQKIERVRSWKIINEYVRKRMSEWRNKIKKK